LAHPNQWNFIMKSHPPVYIVSAVRTPMGSFMGALSSIPATALGSIAIRGAIEKAGIAASEVQEVYMGQVLQAGAGQAPARQAALGAGIPNTVPCTTVNKVCASGMKSLALAAQSIALGTNDVVVAGGMENMSMVPHYLQARQGVKLGNITARDGMVLDGLTDVYLQQHMGQCADLCAKTHDISREAQDAFAVQSYSRAAAAWKEGRFDAEVVGVPVPQRKGEPIWVREDEEFKSVQLDKIPALKPVFTTDGTVTAANASTLNDGASAVVLASESAVARLGLTPIGKLVAWADAAHEPEWFTTAPAKALPIALERAGWSSSDVDLWELNEAFAVVGLVNNQLLGLDGEKVNVHGGAVALGHPLGSSGCRIVVTLLHALHAHGLRRGAAGICNGGGGASAMLVERL
jgi:acetyl-CoA C-acetyltransferase